MFELLRCYFETEIPIVSLRKGELGAVVQGAGIVGGQWVVDTIAGTIRYPTRVPPRRRAADQVLKLHTFPFSAIPLNFISSRLSSSFPLLLLPSLYLPERSRFTPPTQRALCYAAG